MLNSENQWWNSIDSNKGSSTGNFKSYGKCADTHGKLPITVGGKTYYVQGGSCTSPGGENGTTGVDIVVGLDMGFQRTARSYPWTEGVEFLYRVQDMGVPENMVSFKSLLKYLEEQILAGKKVFVGCIGGHGRTGIVLAALLNHMTGEKDAITVVREAICKKCVESSTQVEWLKKNFGITPVKPTKDYSSGY